MAFRRVCDLDDLWEGEMKSFDVEGGEVLLVFPGGGEVIAIQPRCPHQDVALAEGEFDGTVLVCRAHHWEFQPATGAGLNPTDCRLKRYRTKIEDDAVWVDGDDSY
jgi:toluene monooxygenase system ferredoxin subunit